MRGKKPGSLAGFTCKACGEVEMVAGGRNDFLCKKCKPSNHYTLTPQYQAHLAVAKAIKSGELDKPSDFACVDCGSPASQYDHRDYSKPLSVEPVCRRCNRRRGSAIGRTTPAPAQQESAVA